MTESLECSCRFNFPGQLTFAKLSGDYNPIHVDRVYARRGLAGDVLVHGVHALLWALEEIIPAFALLQGLAGMSVRFHRPVLLGRPVRLKASIDAGNKVAFQVDASGVVLLSGLVEPGISAPLGDVSPPPVALCETPQAPAFSDLNLSQGALPLWLDRAEARAQYPHVMDMLGARRLAAILACTRLVGMVAPGLNSLFTGLSLRFSDDVGTESELRYSVGRLHMLAVPLRIEVQADGVAGTVEALYRPVASEQPAVAELKESVAEGEFRGQVALVVGGSRGIGEVAAKLIAAGGGFPVVTWHRGKTDASRVVQDIRANGGRCDSLRMDCRKPVRALEQLTKRGIVPTHLYYFATPRISDAAAQEHDPRRLTDFLRFYVDAFRELVLSLAQTAPIRVFYPSTVFVDDVPRGEADYAAAKAAGEVMCRHLARHYPNVSVVARRLPKLPTDQTLSIIKQAAVSPVPVMVEVLREMSDGK